jgi:hypothetical protein
MQEKGAMTSAAAQCRISEGSKNGRARQAALVIGSAEFTARMRDLFRHSRWELACPAEPESASEELARNEFPVVICEGDWRKVTDPTSELPNPPVVITVDKSDARACQNAIENGVLYLDERGMRPGVLFPLLNHAWRIKNQD